MTEEQLAFLLEAISDFRYYGGWLFVGQALQLGVLFYMAHLVRYR